MYQSDAFGAVSASIDPSSTNAEMPAILGLFGSSWHGPDPSLEPYGSEGWGFDSLRAHTIQDHAIFRVHHVQSPGFGRGSGAFSPTVRRSPEVTQHANARDLVFA